MNSDLWGISIVTGGLLGLLVLAEWLNRAGLVRSETSRKFVHVGGGLLCIVLPWMVHSPWSVLLLAVLSTTVLLAGRMFGRLKGLHSVDRKTLGSEFYPFAVFLTFLISEGRNWLYVCGILVLALADASAALVGTRYGRLRYRVEDREKSVEGSLTFLLVTTLAVALPTLLLTDYPPLLSMAAAVTVGLLVTGLEAISLGGSDNLFVPVGVCVILSKTLAHPLSNAIYQLASLVILAFGVGVLAWRSHAFNVGGAITFLLFVFGTWSMGSELWAVPVLLAFIVYAAALRCYPSAVAGHPSIRVQLVFRAVLVPFLLLLVGNMFLICGSLYLPFVGTSAAALALTLWNHIGDRTGGTLLTATKRAARSGLLGMGSAAIMLLLPTLSISWISSLNVLWVLMVVTATAVANGLIRHGSPPVGETWGSLQLGLVSLCAAILVGGILLG